MGSKSKSDFFESSINTIFNRLKQRNTSLLDALVSQNPEEQKGIANAFLKDIELLKLSLSPADHPNWLEKIRGKVEGFNNSRLSNINLMRALVEEKNNIDKHKWIFQKEDNDFFDFDSMFERYRSEGKLPEFFDEIIKLLTEILDSGEIESAFVLDSLNKIIGTLKKSKKGSFFSMTTAWGFFLDFAENYLWDQLTGVTGLNALTQTLRNAVEKTTIEVKDLTQVTYENVRSEVAAGTKVYKKNGKEPSLPIYSHTGEVSLPLSEPKLITKA